LPTRKYGQPLYRSGSERRRSLGYVQSGVQVIFDIGAAVLGITEAENGVA
jgi:hypothetical protein